MSNYFSQFNTGYLFELPESLTSKPNAERYLGTAKAAEVFGDSIVPVIAFGVSKNHSEDAVTEENGWVATNEVQINVPEHQIPVLKKMMADRNAVKLCKEGHMGVRFVSYQNNWGKQWKVEFVDR